MIRDNVDSLLERSIAIIEKQICMLENLDKLDRNETDKLIEYTKVLVIIRKDWRQDKEDMYDKTINLKDDELEAELKAELKKLMEKSGK